MGFFSDLKEDLSQAVNELMPADEQTQEEGFGDINEMLDRVDSIVVSGIGQEEPEAPEELPAEEPEVLEGQSEEQKSETTEESAEGAEIPAWNRTESVGEIPDWNQEESAGEIPEEYQTERTGDALEAFAEEKLEAEPVAVIDLEKTQESAPAADDGNAAQVYELKEAETVTDNQKETKGESKVAEMINARMASDETSSVTAGMTINGDVVSEGSLDLIGCVNGNIDILGKLNATGYINGNSKAAEIYADNAKINGELVSEGAVKIGSSSVVVGNICATSAVIAGAVKGDIDVKGPVILDTSAIVMGNIKSKSVQINNGAVIEGMCSQCYAEVNPISFFDDYKPEVRKR